MKIHSLRNLAPISGMVLLDTTGPARNNPRHLAASGRWALPRARWPLGGSWCNICRVGLCNASIRNVRRAGTGCAPICPVPMPAWNSVLLAGALCRPYLRRSVRVSAWGRARWPRARPCALVHA